MYQSQKEPRQGDDYSIKNKKQNKTFDYFPTVLLHYYSRLICNDNDTVNRYRIVRLFKIA